MHNTDLLTRAFVTPSRIKDFDLTQWELLIRQGRKALLLAKLYKKICQSDLDDKILPAAKCHLTSANTVANRNRISVPMEVERVRKLLASLGLDLVLLKGAAYATGDLPAADGRTFTDIDILVPEARLDEIEKTFKDDGWIGQHLNKYDQQYYRQWMHEIPALRHFRTGTLVDIHHTILPPTSKYHPDPKKLLESAIKVKPGVYTLCPEDMVIHSATHLFHEGEFEHGLRDLVDIHELLLHFGEHEPCFWDKLVPRAIDLDLITPLYYALHYCSIILDTKIPDRVLEQSQAGAPNPLMSRVMDFLFVRALRPNHPSCDLPFSSMARFMLYIRSHYLRMPLYLLIPHLVRKAWKKRFEENKPETPHDQQG
jgi:hypothetical protein